MGLMDWLLGRSPGQPAQRRSSSRGIRGGMTEDERAIDRYRYLLRTAPPETIEQAHAEAFAQLSPPQRQIVLQELAGDLPPAERTAALRSGDNPRALAQTATRAELRRPGTLERRLGGMSAPGMGIGLGGVMAGSFLSTLAGVVVGSAIADAFFGDAGYHEGDGGDMTLGNESGGDDQGGGLGDAGAAEVGGAELGTGDFGDGNFGGGDFGGDF